MILDLKYKPEYDLIPDSEFPKALDGIFCLSLTVERCFGIKSHKPIAEKLMKENPSFSKEKIWYLSILYILKNRAKSFEQFYLESLIKQIIIRYSGNNPPEDISLLVGQVNSVISDEGLFVSMYESLNEDDKIIYKIACLKDKIKKDCEKYFVYKNLKKNFVQSTLGENNVSNKYINYFDFLFDVMLMLLINSVQDIFARNIQEDEAEIRSIIFSDIEKFSNGTFLKYNEEITNSICSHIAQCKLAVEGDENDVKR